MAIAFAGVMFMAAMMVLALPVWAKDVVADSMHAQMLAPSYKLYSGSTPRCSSTIIKSKRDEDGQIETLVLTAAHCIATNLNIRKQSLDANLDVYKETVFYLEPVRVFKPEDVAVLRVIDKSEQFPVARLAMKRTSPPMGRKVWVVGYPKSLDITLTAGEYGGLVKNPRPNMPLMVRATAPIHPGSSGGGLFIKTVRGYELIGVTSGHWRDTSFMNYFSRLEPIHRAIPTKRIAAVPVDF